MVYIIKINVDGGCRANGQPGSIACAAAAFKDENGKYYGKKTEALPSFPRPTNQQAEITAVILGLEMALERYDQLSSTPWLDVTIYSDSAFAVNCMTKWVVKWIKNGWTNSKGHEVANQDLIKKAVDLDNRLKEEGDRADHFCQRGYSNGLGGQVTHN
ncbi:ribonuclease H-like domain-containing protein [Aspergillus venezuelensis]